LKCVDVDNQLQKWTIANTGSLKTLLFIHFWNAALKVRGAKVGSS